MSNPMLNAMKTSTCQSGVVLVTGLLFLLVVTIIAVTAANNSTLGLRMSASMQDSYRSFQSAEAGVDAVLGLANTPRDPFKLRDDTADPFQVPSDFQGEMNHPFRNQASDPNTVPTDVNVDFISTHPCRVVNYSNLFNCDYYRIKSEHVQPGRARTQIQAGVAVAVKKK
jgi:type IV pilus assembly protein PilX